MKDSLLRSIEKPKFKVGETVILLGKNEEAIVVSLSWHYKFAEPVYKVKVNGKIKLYTDRKPCPSCEHVIDEFRKMYPEIELTVIYNGN